MRGMGSIRRFALRSVGAVWKDQYCQIGFLIIGASFVSAEQMTALTGLLLAQQHTVERSAARESTSHLDRPS